jgi:hypothetical protein
MEQTCKQAMELKLWQLPSRVCQGQLQLLPSHSVISESHLNLPIHVFVKQTESPLNWLAGWCSPS